MDPCALRFEVPSTKYKVPDALRSNATVHPAFERMVVGVHWTFDSGRAPPQHPEQTRLGLLPSGPDPIHGVPPLRDPAFNIDRTSVRPGTISSSGGEFSSA